MDAMAEKVITTQINEVVEAHIIRLDNKLDENKDIWECVEEEGHLKIYRGMTSINMDFLKTFKAYHMVMGITAHEMCRYFWDIDVKPEWDDNLESCKAVNWLSEDTFMCYSVMKRVWPTSQRDVLYWSHIRHIPRDKDNSSDRWMVVNYSTEDSRFPTNIYARVSINIAMICETITEQPTDGTVTRDNIKCKIAYISDINPGGWVPVSVLNIGYKKEISRFLKLFSQYVNKKVSNQSILY